MDASPAVNTTAAILADVNTLLATALEQGMRKELVAARDTLDYAWGLIDLCVDEVECAEDPELEASLLQVNLLIHEAQSCVARLGKKRCLFKPSYMSLLTEAREGLRQAMESM